MPKKSRDKGHRRGVRVEDADYADYADGQPSNGRYSARVIANEMTSSRSEYIQHPHKQKSPRRHRRKSEPSTHQQTHMQRPTTMPLRSDNGGHGGPRSRGGRHKSRTQVNIDSGDTHTPQQQRNRLASAENNDSDDDDAAEGTELMLKIGRAFLARLLFVIHSLIAIWQTVKAYDNPTYWGFALISVSIMLEGAYAIILRAGDERKWFCPSVLLYILCTAPPIWALELDMSRTRFLHLNFTHAMTVSAKIAEQQVQGLNMSHEFSIQLLEQFLLVILILGRWLLPKGEISREQLSQILLAYLAISSDIVELFDVFKEPNVVRHAHLQYLVLTCWFLSLLQFPFVLTVSKARKMRVALTHSSSYEEIRRLHVRSQRGEMSILDQILRDVDIWAIILANMFQDVPFLITRLILMLGYGVFTYTMIFFTCKNLLIILLQSYRASVIIHDRYQRASPDDDARRLIEHYTKNIIHGQRMLREMQTRHSEIFKEAINHQQMEKVKEISRENALASLYKLKTRSEQQQVNSAEGDCTQPLLNGGDTSIPVDRHITTQESVEYEHIDETPTQRIETINIDFCDDDRSIESGSQSQSYQKRKKRHHHYDEEALEYDQAPRRSKSGGFDEVVNRHPQSGHRHKTRRHRNPPPQMQYDVSRESLSEIERRSTSSVESPRKRRRRITRRDSDLRDIFEDEDLYGSVSHSKSPRRRNKAGSGDRTPTRKRR